MANVEEKVALAVFDSFDISFGNTMVVTMKPMTPLLDVASIMAAIGVAMVIDDGV